MVIVIVINIRGIMYSDWAVFAEDNDNKYPALLGEDSDEVKYDEDDKDSRPNF